MSRRRSVGVYAGQLRLSIQDFKYQGRRLLAVPLAAMLREIGSTSWVGDWGRSWSRG